MANLDPRTVTYGFLYGDSTLPSQRRLIGKVHGWPEDLGWGTCSKPTDASPVCFEIGNDEVIGTGTYV